jgi:CSLREA domain-containing protein
MRTLTRYFKAIIIIVIILSLVGFSPSPAPAANIYVSTFVDEYGSGENCSLREAITAATTNAIFGGCTAGSGTDNIYLEAGTYTLSIAGANEDANTTGDLDIITQAVSLRGSTTGTTTIDGGDIDRVLDVRITCFLYDLVITNGRTVITDAVLGKGGGIYNTSYLVLNHTVVTYNETGAGPSNGGGGIYNTGNLNLTNNSAVSHNFVGAGNTNGCGGGIYYYDTISGVVTLTINSSTISDNSCGAVSKGNSAIGGDGGGIFFTGTDTDYAVDANINDSTISGNHAADGTNLGAGNGGGIFINQIGSSITIDQSALINNHAGDNGNNNPGGNGGAIANYDGSVVVITNSTISANYAGDGDDNIVTNGGNGGGIFNDSYLDVRYSTIADNHTGNGSAAGVCTNGCSGGGVYDTNDGDSEVDYSILADNQASSYGPDCIGSWAIDWSMVQDSSNCNITGGYNRLDMDARLSALANNSGPTPTHALYANSPAIDQIDCTASVDQRGITRPLDGNRDGTAWCDMGSYEASFLFNFIPLLRKP